MKGTLVEIPRKRKKDLSISIVRWIDEVLALAFEGRSENLPVSTVKVKKITIKDNFFNFFWAERASLLKVCV